MKKVVSTILISLIILLCSSYVLGATGKVTADTLNVRESASKSSKVIARIAKDQEVEILEDNGEWLKIKYKSYTGFVSSKFISKTEESKEPSKAESKSTDETKEEPVQTVTETKRTENTEYISNKESKLKENVKVYSLPTLSSYTLGDLKSGTSLLVINSAGQWAYVQTDTISGWIKLSATELVEEEPIATDPVEEEPPKEVATENKVTEENTTKIEETTPEETTTEKTDNESYPKTMYTNKSSVIIRYEPSKNSGIMNSLNLNAKVTVTAKEGEWYKITLKGDTGYIYYTLLSDKQS